MGIVSTVIGVIFGIFIIDLFCEALLGFSPVKAVKALCRRLSEGKKSSKNDKSDD